MGVDLLIPPINNPLLCVFTCPAAFANNPSTSAFSQRCTVPPYPQRTDRRPSVAPQGPSYYPYTGYTCHSLWGWSVRIWGSSTGGRMRSRPYYSRWGEAHDGEGGFVVSTAHHLRTADGRTGCCLLFLKGDAIMEHCGSRAHWPLPLFRAVLAGIGIFKIRTRSGVNNRFRKSELLSVLILKTGAIFKLTRSR